MPDGPAMSVWGRQVHRPDRAHRGNPPGGGRIDLSGPDAIAPPIGPSAKIQLTPQPLPISSHLKARSTNSRAVQGRGADERAARVEILPGKPKPFERTKLGFPIVDPLYQSVRLERSSSSRSGSRQTSDVAQSRKSGDFRYADLKSALAEIALRDLSANLHYKPCAGGSACRQSE
jgi:hypothetical protein